MDSKLFSLELFIDRLRIVSNEKCLFPSTVLKFMGYEPALLSSVNDKIKDEIKDYLDLDFQNQNTKKICQLEELKDSDGNFVIRKGKSILFESTLLSLVAELHSIPLYVLIVDDYFTPSHLVGVVSVDLSGLIDRLAHKMCGSSIGSVSEDLTNKANVVDLMGNSVGLLTLRLRIICVGDNLAPHLKVEKEVEIRRKTNKHTHSKNAAVGDSAEEEEYIEKSEKSTERPFVAVRSVGSQAKRSRTVRIQTVPKPDESNRLARIGLTIDPYDPLLEAPPPMIYNSVYGGYTDSEDEQEEAPPAHASEFAKQTPHTSPTKIKSSSLKPENFPTLSNLLNELKVWKSGEQLVEIDDTALGKQDTAACPRQTKSLQSAPVRPPKPTSSGDSVNHRDSFLRRMSRPKQRSAGPEGQVPSHRGWLRSEPQYGGPSRSALQYKLTKTQIRRVQLRRMVSGRRDPPLPCPAPTKTIAELTTEKPIPFPSKMRPRTRETSSLSSMSPRGPRQRRTIPPSVPPLFAPDTSFSQPSDTLLSVGSTSAAVSAAVRQSHRPQTTLNPVQSTRSPQMTVRSQAMLDDEEETDYTGDHDGAYQQGNTNFSHYEEEEEENDSDFSGPYKPSKHSQVSQTSQWHTEYSHDDNETDASGPPRSLDLGTFRSPPHSPQLRRPPRILGGIFPGGRMPTEEGISFSGSGQSQNNHFRASFNEAVERDRPNGGTSLSQSRSYTGDYEDEEDDDNLYNTSMARPSSIGADVTSFTKVTRYESQQPIPNNVRAGSVPILVSSGQPQQQSLAGQQYRGAAHSMAVTTSASNNPQPPQHSHQQHANNQLLYSTLGGASLRTDDSQIMLSSHSYFE